MTGLRYEYCPPFEGSRLDHVGTYKRPLPVNLDRMYENALDWEHLPYLHGSSFTQITCLDAGAWGWRCRVVDSKEHVRLLELRLDRTCRRWITRNLEGPSQGTEIWTHVFVTGPHQMDIVIDFFVPGVPQAAREKVGIAYARSYESLYDEDVWMMTERQKQLDDRLDAIDMTEESEVDVTGDLPIDVSMSGRTFLIDRFEDEWVIYPQTCPHQLGPMAGRVAEDGTITCPWHGYAFDVRSGECSTGHHCRFGRRPNIMAQGSNKLLLTWGSNT